jgi:hypothetical protein
MYRSAKSYFQGSTCNRCGKLLGVGSTIYIDSTLALNGKTRCEACYVQTTTGEKPLSPPSTPEQPPQTTAPVDDNHIRDIAKSESLKAIKSWGTEKCDEIKEHVLTRSEDIIRKTAEKIFRDEASRTLILKTTDRKIKITGAHRQTSDLAQLINARRHVYIYGERGTGKTHVVLQLCEAIGLRVFMESGNPFFTPHDYKGYMNAMGSYTATALYRFLTCTEPCALFVDEFDRQRVDAPSVLNSLLAQGHITFPNGETHYLRNDGTQVIIASGNTAMRGGSTAYAAASKQELSTIDRFFYLYWGIDENLESNIARSISPRYAESWVNWVRSIRIWYARPENRNMIEDSPSPRAVFDGLTTLETTTLSVNLVADGAVFKGIAADVKAKILQSCPLPKLVRE